MNLNKKFADFTVLAENPLKVAPEKIKDIQVTEVIIGGKQVYPNFKKYHPRSHPKAFKKFVTL